MNLSKINVIQGLGSLIALLMYLFLPVIRFALMMVTGFSGEACMQVESLFVIPVVLLAIALVSSFLPIGNKSSLVGLAMAFGMLLFGLLCKNALGDKVNLLLNQLASQANLDPVVSGVSGSLLSSGVTMMLRMGWGMIASIAVMFVSSLAGLLVRFDGGESYDANRPSSRTSTVGRNSTAPSHRSTSRPTSHRR